MKKETHEQESRSPALHRPGSRSVPSSRGFAARRYRSFERVNALPLSASTLAEQAPNTALPPILTGEQAPQRDPGRSPEQRQVSVIVRSMNRRVLDEALDSVAAQTYPDVEVVVVNAAGGVHRNVGAFCGQFPLRVVGEGQPLHRAQAANAGMDAARGEYLIFLDDDDLFEPSHIANLVATLEDCPECQAAYAGVRVENRAGVTVGTYHEWFSSARLMEGNYIPIHAVLFERRLLSRGCRFDERLYKYEDWDFWLQVARHTAFERVDGVTAIYRAELGRSGMALPSGDAEQRLSRLKIWEKWWQIWTVEDFDQLVQVHRAQLSSKDEALLAARQQQTSLERDLAAVEQELAALQRDIASLHEAMVDSVRVVDGLHRELACKQEELQAEAHLAAQSRQQVESLREQLATADQQRTRFVREIATLQEDLLEKRTELDALHHLVAQRGGQIDLLAEQLRDRTRLVAERDREIEQLRLAIHEVLNSTSWRLTSPARRFKMSLGLFRRAVRSTNAVARNGLRYARGRSTATLVRRIVAIVRTEGIRGIGVRLNILDEMYRRSAAAPLQAKHDKTPAQNQHLPLSHIDVEKYQFFFFDVFDTAILRLFRQPTDIFEYIGMAAGDRTFAELRSRKEAEARGLNPQRREINIQEIYRHIPDYVADGEHAAERTFCVANPEVMALYEKLVAAGKQVYFVSDMYLDEEVVATILLDNGYFRYAGLFISSKDDLIKGDGSRFADLKMKLPDSFQNAIHIGDNRIADYLQPRAHGYDAFLYVDRDTWFRSDPFLASKYSGLISKHSVGISFLLGAFRYWKVGFQDSPPNYWRQFGFFYGGALVSCFCRFISKQIGLRALECKKVFFLARDGDIMCKVYNILHDDLEPIYLLASRRCMAFPSFRSLVDPRDQEMLKLFTTPIGIGHADDLIARFNYSDLGTLRADLGRLPGDPSSWSDLDISACLLKNRHAIMDKVVEERQVLLEYLDDMGFFAAKDIAVADVGWGGTIQNGLSVLADLAGRTANRIHGFYMGVNAGVANSSQKTGFLFDGDQSAYVDFLNLIELLTSSPQDSVIRIVRTQEGFVPVTAVTSTHEKERQRAATDIQRGIMDFAGLIKTRGIDIDSLCDTEDFRILFASLQECTSDEDVAHLGQLRHAMTLGNNFHQQVLVNALN